MEIQKPANDVVGKLPVERWPMEVQKPSNDVVEVPRVVEV